LNAGAIIAILAGCIGAAGAIGMKGYLSKMRSAAASSGPSNGSALPPAAAAENGVSTLPALTDDDLIERKRSLGSDLPSGTITFLMTDIEGSTKLWQDHPDEMRTALNRHDDLFKSVVVAGHGSFVKSTGDGMLAVFARAPDAVATALNAQLALLNAQWEPNVQLNVRMALHAGVAHERDADYFGTAVNRVARLMAIGSGRQVLLSAAVHELTIDSLPDGCSLLDLGVARLADLSRPETVYQLAHPNLPATFPPLRSLDVLPNNLPLQTTTFVGRDAEAAAVKASLAQSRLVTLMGPGGAGKTRLALRVAAELLAQTEGGVWLVELANISDPGLAAHAVASAMGIREEPGLPIHTTLVNDLKSRKQQTLIVLDNCEHVLTACADLAAQILRSCQNVRLLATSRESLRIRGETAHVVPPLSLPDHFAGAKGKRTSPVSDLDLEELRNYESVQLFVDRAEAVSQSFTLSASNASAVASICRQLEGIPLALELVAPRVRVLPADEIAQRLENIFEFVPSGGRDAAERHGTLRAAIDWSYELLPEKQRLLFRRLSCFSGGATLEAVEEVCAFEDIGRWEVLDLLESLVEKSLLQFTESGPSPRYRSLETLRQYARELENNSPDNYVVRRNHYLCFLSFAKRAEAQLTGPEQADWLRRLDDEHANILSAIECAMEAEFRDDGCSAVELGSTLFRYWRSRDFASKGRSILEKALNGEPNTPEPWRGKGLYSAAVLAYDQCEYAAALSYGEQSLVIARDMSDPKSVAQSLGVIGLTAIRTGDLSRARDCFEETLELAKSNSTPRGIAVALQNLGHVASELGEYGVARGHYTDALKIFQEIGDLTAIADTLSAAATAATNEGEYEIALNLSEQSRLICRDLADPQGEAYALANVAEARLRMLLNGLDESRTSQVYEILDECVDLVDGLEQRTLIAAVLELYAQAGAVNRQWRYALTLISAAGEERKRINSPASAAERGRLDQVAEILRIELGDGIADQICSEGISMSLEQAVGYARRQR
jgi:predicted ATPase/class 3 adenylate cyclase